jgi:propionyl-CoA synthetase
MTAYADFYRRSIDNHDGFGAEQAQLVDWKTPPQQVCDYSNPPFARWFVGGTTRIDAMDASLLSR